MKYGHGDGGRKQAEGSPTCIRPYLETMEAYLQSQAACMEFLQHRARIVEGKLIDIKTEVKEYTLLGMPTLAVELGNKMKGLSGQLQEDQGAQVQIMTQAQLASESLTKVCDHADIPFSCKFIAGFRRGGCTPGKPPHPPPPPPPPMHAFKGKENDLEGAGGNITGRNLDWVSHREILMRIK
ncbi:unnamed protein product, partial [Discosporangium mesarthrocarpum]